MEPKRTIIEPGLAVTEELLLFLRINDRCGDCAFYGFDYIPPDDTKNRKKMFEWVPEFYNGRSNRLAGGEGYTQWQKDMYLPLYARFEIWRRVTCVFEGKEKILIDRDQIEESDEIFFFDNFAPNTSKTLRILTYRELEKEPSIKSFDIEWELKQCPDRQCIVFFNRGKIETFWHQEGCNPKIIKVSDYLNQENK